MTHRNTFHYANHRQGVADLYLPEGPDVGGPAPVAVLVHGGFWRASYERDLMHDMAVDLAERGWAAVNVEYRRGGSGGGWPQTWQDVAAAVAALATIEPDLGGSLDLGRTVAIGHSAGGHIALWLAANGHVGAGLGLGAVCDLATAARSHMGGDAVVELLGVTPDQAPDVYEALDCARGSAGQVLFHGTRDDRVPIEHARTYASCAVSAGVDCRLVEQDGVDHFAAIDPTSQAWAQVVAVMEDLG